jgi:hypothetical protein
MRRLSLAVLFALALALATAGCDNGKCAGDHDGTWTGTTVPDQIDLSSSCDFEYSGVGGCKSSGTYAAPLGTQGSVQVVITSSTGGMCLAAGTYNCTYAAGSTILTFNCGAGTFSYGR